MEPSTNDALLDEVIDAIGASLPSGIGALGPETNLLSGDIDLDSLQIIELVDELRGKFGVDFLGPGFSIRDLRSPRTVADALARGGGQPRSR